jgi:hypothetical protein
MPLPQAVVDEARGIVASLTETAYQYHQSIDATAGVFLCDCSEFVSFVLSVAAPEQLALIKPEAHQPVPRAFVYCDYFQNLPANSDKGCNGVGIGIIYFQVDPNGRPIAFLFGPGATGYVDVEIRIGRVEPI